MACELRLIALWAVALASTAGCDDGSPPLADAAAPDRAMVDARPLDGPLDAAPDLAPDGALDAHAGDAEPDGPPPDMWPVRGPGIDPDGVEISPDAIYDPAVLRDLHLALEPAEFEALRADVACETFFPATLWLDGEPPILVGLRRKGGFRLPIPEDVVGTAAYPCLGEAAIAPDPLPEKVSLKVDINELVRGQRWHGLRKLNLENGGDASIVREGLAWMLMGSAAHYSGRAAWIRLFVNGEPQGVYLHVEQIDNSFLRNRDLDRDGHLWKEAVQRTCGGEQRDPLTGGWPDPLCGDPLAAALCYAPFVGLCEMFACWAAAD